MDAPPSPPPTSGDVGASFARWCLALVLVWTGAMRFTADGAALVGELLAQNRLLSGLSGSLDAGLLAVAMGVLQVGAGLLLFFGKRPGIRFRTGALVSAVLAGLSLTLFLTNPVWIEDLGGFPYLGSGQSLLKHVTVLGVSVYLFAEGLRFGVDARPHLVRMGLDLTLAGLVLSFGWIGLMKFTAVEATAIEPLLSTSPLLSWMLAAFGSQGASNVIGAVEVLIAVLLAGWWFMPALFRAGAPLAGLTFLVTLSFLVTLPGWHADMGFPALSSAGIFLVKDLALLAGVLVLVAETSGGPVAAPRA